ncbi:MAG TPA: sulfatase-like hydrolase/transferase, partial [Planctomycetaceae bacterium]|nr:sulfatase-like hydrolase/transferase [Planctomycetaceae bacterium]
VLQDGEAQGSLLESLDQAGDLWERTHRQNRQALQQLQRQVRIGKSRQAPHLVLITFEHAGDPDSSRDRLFADLSQRGVSFSEHYAGGLSPASGWWSLMTGYPASRASAGEKRFELRESDVTIATTLWKAGYDTAFLGVWPGSAAPLRCGFEEWTGLETPLDDVPLYPARLATARNYMTVAPNANGGQKVSLWTLLDAEIASYFRSHASSSRPWFLQIRLPEIETDSSGGSAESVVVHALEALEKSGVSAQTCVFVTTLSGPRTAPVISEHRLRTPLVMVGGHPENAGRVARNVTVAWDLLPTLLDIAGASKRPHGRDGRSLVQNSSQPPWDNERLLYWQADEQNGAQFVRRGEWFGTVAPGAPQLQLFHLPTDPDLKKDVASAHPAVVQRLLAPETTPAK